MLSLVLIFISTESLLFKFLGGFAFGTVVMESGREEAVQEVSRECRICHSKSTTDMIQSPCLCRGSVGCLHRTCLEKWLRISCNTSCELCAFTFRVVEVRRYSLPQSVGVWLLRDKLVVARASIIVLLLVANPAAACWLWAVWLAEAPSNYFNKVWGDGYDDPRGQEVEEVPVVRWTIIFAILTLMVVVSVLSLYFDVYKNILKRLYRAWYRIRSEPAEVRLVLDPEVSKVSGSVKKEEEKEKVAPSNIDEVGKEAKYLITAFKA